MKRFIILSFLFIFLIAGRSLSQERFQATIKPGSTPNAVLIAITPNTTFSGSFSNVQFTVQVPNTISPQPNVSIKSNPLNSYIPTANYLTDTTDEGGYFTYLFAASVTGGTPYNFVAGTEIPALELEFQDGPKQFEDVRLVHLADGGSTGQNAFYVEIGAADMTNYSASFYGTGVSNGGSYSANSSVIVADILLPVRWLKFDANKNDKDVLVTWTVADEVNCSHYEVERSENGRTFLSIGKVFSKGGYNSTNQYVLTDKNVSNLKKEMVHYRIRQVDLDGKKNYSRINTLRYNMKAILFHLFPNPAFNRATLTLDIPFNERVLISIIDSRGRVVRTQHVNFLKGLNQHTLEVSSLAKGSYDVTLRSENITQSLKLVRQ